MKNLDGLDFADNVNFSLTKLKKTITNMHIVHDRHSHAHMLQLEF